MGIGGIGIGPLILILVIVILLFGTKKLKNLGSDLGGAVKGFKKAMDSDPETTEAEKNEKISDETQVNNSSTEKVSDTEQK